MHDANLEERLRSVLRQEGDGLPFTITAEELERRLALRRRERNGRRLSLMAAGLAAIAVGTIFALGNGWLTNGPAVGTDATPSPDPNASAAPSASPAPAASMQSALPSLAMPPGTVVVDVTGKPDTSFISGESVQFEAGIVPPRGQYRVALVCVGGGTIRWDIGLFRFAGGGERSCDGSATTTDVSEGVPPEDMGVIVTTSPRNTWRIVITYEGDAPAFIAPQLFAFAGDALVGNGAGGLASCVRWNDVSDSCGVPFLARDGAREVTVPVDSSLGIVLADGWRIDSVSVDAMDRDAARRDPFGVGRELPNVDEGGERVAIPLAGLEGGEWVVRLTVSGSKGDDTFGGTYSIPVIIEG